ncbi:MAG: lipopolysaccharide heptosyltransferase I [Gammaproteobacteria bacterium]|nr:MAG: lipopolysaccharide heptosyltransferase I [Gammaproteobacteria bacterium]
MRVLIIKTSSMGDIIHTFPALSDAVRANPSIRFDWVVEEAFEEIPKWHPAVDQVIPSAMRRWRKSWLKSFIGGEIRCFKKILQATTYDAVIDAQGLLKSAFLIRKALGPKYGLDEDSAREPLASRFYDHRLAVPWNQHAVERVRQLFSMALDYKYYDMPLDYGLNIKPLAQKHSPAVMLLHGTTWSSKQWSMDFWTDLANQANQDGFHVLLPAGNDSERLFADQVAQQVEAASVLSGMQLSEIAGTLAAVDGFVAVDTGLAHLAAALSVPGVSLYGATLAEKTGTLGRNQQHIQADIECSPCFKRTCPILGEGQTVTPCSQQIDASAVWQKLTKQMQTRETQA